MSYWIIEDSAILADQLRKLLHQHGLVVSHLMPNADLAGFPASDASVFVSLQLRGANAFALLRRLHAHGCRRLVAISASGLVSERCWAKRCGAAQVLCRPLDKGAMAACLAQLDGKVKGHA